MKNLEGFSTVYKFSKMKAFPSHILLFSVLAILCSCAKSPNILVQPGPMRNIPEEFKAWTIFQPESYWIYLNEKTGITDTTSFKHGPYYNKTIYWNAPPVEYMWFYTNGPLMTRYDDEGGVNGNATLNLWLKTGGSVLALTHKTLLDPEHSDSSTYYFSYWFIEQLPVLTLNNNHFQNVCHTRLSRKYSYYQTHNTVYDFYFARGIGLIRLKKADANTDTTWSIMHWKTSLTSGTN
jgi:hypothetical protein